MSVTGSQDLRVLNSAPAHRIESLLVKPASALCNLDCTYCFYLDRESDPYKALLARRMSEETLEALVNGYLFYSYPLAAFSFQGGEPTLAGLRFFERLIELQKRCGRNGQSISNSIQTNGLLLNDDWCRLFKDYEWLVGISLDGPEPVHDAYRLDRGGAGSWSKVMAAVECLKRNRVEFNVLCVVSRANVEHAREVYRFFRSLRIEHLQYIPLAEFEPGGKLKDFGITPEQYGRFLCQTFDLWWPERRQVRVRFFDNLTEALLGTEPSTCTLRGACDSYAVVEYNGDVYPCDFFVEEAWKLGNVHTHSWAELARVRRRPEFAAKKAEPHAECSVCEYAGICHGGCPRHRYDQRGHFEDLDYLCAAYKMIFGKALGPLRREAARLAPKRGGPTWT